MINFYILRTQLNILTSSIYGRHFEREYHMIFTDGNFHKRDNKQILGYFLMFLFG